MKPLITVIGDAVLPRAHVAMEEGGGIVVAPIPAVAHKRSSLHTETNRVVFSVVSWCVQNELASAWCS